MLSEETRRLAERMRRDKGEGEEERSRRSKRSRRRIVGDSIVNSN